MRIFRCIMLFCSISMVFVCCSLLPDELKTAEKLIENQPDSALHILRHMPSDKYKSDAGRALYNLLLIQVLNKKQLPLEPDTLLDFSIEYYSAHNDGDNRLATAYLYKGRIYKNKLQYEKAMVFYLKAEDAINDKTDFILQGRICFDMGDIYNIQHDYTLARQKYKKAYSYFSNAKFQVLSFFSLLNIGRTYHSAKEYKTARNYYQSIRLQAKDSLQQGALFQEIGLNYFDFKKPDSALYYYRKTVNYPCLGNERSHRCFFLADLFFELNQIDSAFFYASKAFRFDPDIRTQRACYRILANSEYLKGNMEQMSGYMNKYVYLGDSLRKIEAQTKGSYIESMHNTEKEVVKTRQWIWYLASAVVLLIGLGIYLYYLFRKRKDRELTETKVKHREQKEILRKDVMHKHRDVLQLKIENTKAGQSEKRKKLSPAEKDALDRQLYNDLLHFNDTAFFFRQMDANLNNLVTKLKERYPGVSDREISWCCLTLLNVSLPDILLLLDYKVNALNKMKQRLAAKFNLENAFELVPFLTGILAED